MSARETLERHLRLDAELYAPDEQPDTEFIAAIREVLEENERLNLSLSGAITEGMRAKKENERLRTGGIIEVAVENLNVQHYMEHWEGRAERAEEEVERLRAEVDELRKLNHEVVQDEIEWRNKAGDRLARIDAALNVATVALLIPHYAYGDSEGGVSLADALRATVNVLKGEK